MPNDTFFMKRLNDHVQYLKEVDKTLRGESNFEGTDAHNCALGKWMDGEGKAEIAKLHSPKAQEIFQSMFDIHEQFHELGKQAIAQQKAGDTHAARMTMTRLFGISAEITSKLLELDRLSK
jgi:hypothetical protein